MLILLIALPLLTGLAAALPFPSRRGRLTFLLTMQIIETALVVWTLVSGRSYTTNIWHLTESLTIAMKLDGVAAVFSALTVVAWLLALIYSVEYMSHSQNEARFYVFLFLSEGMLLGTALSADFVSMYVFYELTSLCSMPLVLHELTHDAVTGAMKYLYYSIGGAFFVLFGIVVLYTNTSTLDFAPGGTLIAGQHTGLELLAVFFVVLGFGTKAGLFPMHNWLPSAHPVAPAPASALLSGIITKAGVIGIIRVLYFIAGPSALRGTWVQTACLVLALGTVFIGSMLAYGERDFKKRLAYSSISQISYVLTALFLLTEDGLTGGLLQVFFHAWAKIGLFLIAGVIIHLAGLRNVEDFRGLGRRLPVTFLCLVFVSLSLVGIPPFGGFGQQVGHLSGGTGRTRRPSGLSGPGGAAGVGTADGGISVCSHRQRLLPRRGLRRGATAPGASGHDPAAGGAGGGVSGAGSVPRPADGAVPVSGSAGALRRCG